MLLISHHSYQRALPREGLLLNTRHYNFFDLRRDKFANKKILLQQNPGKHFSPDLGM
jgi:hypothetical protein